MTFVAAWALIILGAMMPGPGGWLVGGAGMLLLFGIVAGIVKFGD